MYNMEDMIWPQGDTKFLFECWKNISQEEKFRNSKQPWNVFLLYKHQWNTKPIFCVKGGVLCCHGNGDLFTCEGNIFTHVKLWCFARKLSLYFICVYIINYYDTLNSTTSKDNLLQTSVVIASVAGGIWSTSALFQSELETLTWLKFI